MNYLDAIEHATTMDIDGEDREYTVFMATKSKTEVLKRRLRPPGDVPPTIRDTRKCDHALTPVAPRRKRISMPEAPPDDGTETWHPDDADNYLSGQPASEHGAWQAELRLHKRRVLHAIWHDPRDPAMAAFLQAQYLHISNNELVHCIQSAIESLGHALYESLRASFQRRLNHGFFSAAATSTRLLTTFKLELRSQVTPDTVRQKVLWGLLEEKAGAVRAHSSAAIAPGHMTLGRFKLEAMASFMATKDAAKESPRLRHQHQQILLDQVASYVASRPLVAHSHNAHPSIMVDEAADRLRHILCVLCHVSCLKTIPMHYKAEMVQAATPLVARRGRMLVSPEVTSTCLYVLVDGCLSVHFESGHSVQKEPFDHFFCGEVDLLSAQPGTMRVTVASDTCSLAVLERTDFDTILEKAIALTSSSSSLQRPPLTTPGGIGLHPRRPKTAAPLGHTVVRTPVKPIAHDDQVREATEASRKHRHDYIAHRRAELEAKRAAAASALAATTAETKSPRKFTAKTKAHIHLLARLKISMTPHMSRPKAATPDANATALPPFAFFPRFPDAFDVRHVELLYMGPQAFEMDEMRLVECGPPLPETPSLVLPPKVQIDTSVLLMEHLALLSGRRPPMTTTKAETSHARAHVEWHSTSWTEPQLPSQPDATLAQFTESRKKVSAPVVKGQKTPYASLAMYCYNWRPEAPKAVVVSESAMSPSQTATTVGAVTVASFSHLFGLDLDPSAAPIDGALHQADGDDEVFFNDVIDGHGPHADAATSLSGLSTNDVAALPTEAAPEQPTPLASPHRSSTAHRDSTLAAVPEDDDHLQGTKDEDADLSAPDQLDVDVEVASDDDGAPLTTKHLFRIPSKRPTPSSTRKLLHNDATSLARKEAYDRLVRQASQMPSTSSSSPRTQDDRLHELAYEEALRDVATADDKHGTPCPLRLHMQQRMESVFTALQLSAKCKLEIVMKYTQKSHAPHLASALELWERAVVSIADRELTLHKIHDFELVASDPRRHFQTISTERLKEQRQRDKLLLLFQAHSTYCANALQQLYDKFGDTILYHDRPYREKMAHDYTELLFDLECERVRIYYGGVSPDIIDETAPTMTTAVDAASSVLVRAVKARGDKDLNDLRTSLTEARAAREAAIASAQYEARERRRAARVPRRPTQPKEPSLQDALGRVLHRPAKPWTTIL
ncbi:hypothetical protein, variant [Saprolegnia diclina VS20]|uniref:Cyclic nucleotide-binding domain-containing protein n=1 Tax=Saprolegnia diclina (strain VS20) TaxID=1156394 RepID=T0R578_SAPDV|nr:hypothetical protein SDRG_14959 [Saprolegnia diclina VS20]XP_008619343.1 hypothetical protein, variant [Saprolegnia diclina VS20]EQC27243.1 hypothetical protein SDRG_14959 [Saprolegnia diclina VS20]EQC27244.1 hypothetical protein, variant [Saprolegnia diclina VS20]|eukprot:XP_008619342.1 hypothetical protein SDRG_14959 [Saprolegnia diclina VS20]